MSGFLSDHYFKVFSDIIYNQSGIHFSETNRCILESRLKERLKIVGLANLDDYYILVLKNQEEMKILLDTVTTNLTRFFRNTTHFQTLENFVFPEMIDCKIKNKDNRLRIWSAGCSTGEEPYSIAIIAKEKVPSHIKTEIIASDLSLKSLMKANTGFYPDSRMGGVSDYYLKKYFKDEGDGYQIKDEIKEMVRFDYHNLKFDSGLHNLDIVFCRNVLIYFDAEAQKEVVNRFWKSMSSYSYLFIGHSESLFGMNTKFEFVRTQWSILYKKNLQEKKK